MTTDTYDELTALSDLWSEWAEPWISDGKAWSRENINSLLDSEFHIGPEAFDQFMQEMSDGYRCASCGRVLESVIDDPLEETTTCSLCGRDWRRS